MMMMMLLLQQPREAAAAASFFFLLLSFEVKPSSIVVAGIKNCTLLVRRADQTVQVSRFRVFQARIFDPLSLRMHPPPLQ